MSSETDDSKKGELSSSLLEGQKNPPSPPKYPPKFWPTPAHGSLRSEGRLLRNFLEGVDTFYEIFCTDIQVAEKFYTAVFPSWTFSPYGEHGRRFENIAGNFMGDIREERRKDLTPEPMFFLGKVNRHLQSVESIDEVKENVEKHGGEAIGEKEHDEGGNEYMVFKDQTGISSLCTRRAGKRGSLNWK